MSLDPVEVQEVASSQLGLRMMGTLSVFGYASQRT